MDNQAREKLAKLLMLTRSDSEGEALNAIRIANTFIDKHNMTWQQVLATSKKSPTNLDDVFRGGGFSTDIDFADVFADLFNNFGGMNPQTAAIRKNNIITMLNAFFVKNSKLWALAGSGQKNWLHAAHKQFSEKNNLHPEDYDRLLKMYNELSARAKHR